LCKKEITIYKKPAFIRPVSLFAPYHPSDQLQVIDPRIRNNIQDAVFNNFSPISK